MLFWCSSTCETCSLTQLPFSSQLSSQTGPPRDLNRNTITEFLLYPLSLSLSLSLSHSLTHSLSLPPFSFSPSLPFLLSLTCIIWHFHHPVIFWIIYSLVSPSWFPFLEETVIKNSSLRRKLLKHTTQRALPVSFHQTSFSFSWSFWCP